MSFFSGVFPYDHAQSLQQLKNECCLPPQEAFFNNLTDSNISDKDYEHACKVFDHFNCDNLLSYYRLYMKLDVALLAEVFFSFRDTMQEHFKLDPCHFISLPSYGFNCMLRMTEVSIDPIPNHEILTFLSSNIRGGFSFFNTRKAKSDKDHELLYFTLTTCKLNFC